MIKQGFYDVLTWELKHSFNTKVAAICQSSCCGPGCTDVPAMCFVTAVMVLLAERPCPSLGSLKKAKEGPFWMKVLFHGCQREGNLLATLQNPRLVRMKTDDEWMMQTQNPSLLCVLWTTRRILAVCAKCYSSSTEIVLIQVVAFQGHGSVRESYTKADHYPLSYAILGRL